MALDLLLDVDLVDVQPVVHAVRIACLAVEEGGFQVERVPQAMGGVDAHHQRPVTQAGQLQAGSGSQAGFPHAALAAEQEDAHNSILPPA